MVMLESLRAEDVIVVYKIDRIARSLKGLVEIIELLNLFMISITIL